ncbi:hypothetical protein B9G69_014400 [Bdellovibrio sp. SKB1291214]|uniref:hypothetical protein n=1 Tax=Bdellovibrio sp. SKB1291214 TaxID=1732569 RepID=UPI000B515143|nr:hypothetical protein [Bdellovibrio sp. SKB1291214]UYL08239.1 hypothetical protein B9G69_014400 [Bdellovibrio sp. SKB1291214]
MKILVILIAAVTATTAWAGSPKGTRAPKILSCGVVYNAENKAGSEVPGVYEDLDTAKLDIKTEIGKPASSGDGFVKVQVSSLTDQDGRDFVTVDVLDAKSKVILAKVKNTVLTEPLNLFVRLSDEARVRMKKKYKGDLAWAELWCSVADKDETAN